MPCLLAATNPFVVSSERDGTSIAFLEAMAAGIAVVATAVGGTPPVLSASEAGLLVPAGDVQALTRSLSALLHDVPRRRTLAAAARTRVEERFSFEAMAMAYGVLYQELTSSSWAVPLAAGHAQGGEILA